MHKIGVIALLCLLSVFAAAVDVGISPTPKLQFSDANGVPMSGALIDTFLCGTTTPTATYTDSTGATPNANPVVADSGGFASIWLAGCTKMRVKNSASVVQYTIDNINILPPWAVVTNPTNTQTISGAALALNNNFTLLQNTAATAIANQSGFSFNQNASYWNGAASAIDQWSWQVVLGTGANPATSLTLTHTGSSGAASVTLPASVLLPNATSSIAVIPNSLGNGGSLSINGGASTGANGNGGGSGVTGGIGNGSGSGGAAAVNGGAGGATGTGGNASVIGGAGGATSGTGGAALILGGNAVGTNSSGGNIILTPGTKTGAGTAGGIRFDNSILQGSGFKHQRFGTTCSTAASVAATCDTTYTWTTTFADGNYTPVCWLVGNFTGVPTMVGFVTRSASQVVIRIAALTAVASSANEVDCVAAHD